MQRKIITTADGSKTIQIEDWNEQYHSVHGAIQEANHVYIKQGLLFFYNEHILGVSETICHSEPNSESHPISILEIGFGTGLNAILTLLVSEELKLNINYCGVEAYPVSTEELSQLNYAEALKIQSSAFVDIHKSDWETSHKVTKQFRLTKQQKFFNDIVDVNCYDVIYFDAFGARVQPELWTEVIFKKMYDALKPNGVLVTYSAKGSVKRALRAVGFSIKRLEGPPGKRHMLRAIKS
ncbi:tRNA (5-methylaminomethyl-2-thiouridine)(34)-methyltransferase MnmD [Psychroserpens ponticola]|uniref:tRNA (5-methylaminomethyl-2-thiouridine)(34)-methyltransferase MnmD n=1 Tax=Psychroserpens ponticola TaxID=2932268 RepID=A0ABY7S0L1_9FLAO|nr:tRNA (5-methylaminomethyl-2-thiouridine)(34)-methyltransferase MnmD [Psychroserpens ponticola]WCO02704.1 tRNA (5-methylaminomethyl-2-thiouridine)(34)-methyltransferase MnmD [Psychroserpens ponticola]